MRTIRLYVDVPLAQRESLELPDAAARHALRVLRLTAGQSLVLFNGDGCDYAAVLSHVHAATAIASVHERRVLANEAPWPLTLAQCLARGDKMDFIVQKATELGATRIVPVLSERSEVRLDTTRARKRSAHWQAVAVAACEQCGRARLPQIDTPQPLGTWLTGMPEDHAQRRALVPGARERVRELRPGAAGLVLVVGPEGGLGERDCVALAAAGFDGLSLGPRVLRTETAGVAALAAILACHGDG